MKINGIQMFCLFGGNEKMLTLLEEKDVVKVLNSLPTHRVLAFAMTATSSKGIYIERSIEGFVSSQLSRSSFFNEDFSFFNDNCLGWISFVYRMKRGYSSLSEDERNEWDGLAENTGRISPKEIMEALDQAIADRLMAKEIINNGKYIKIRKANYRVTKMVQKYFRTVMQK